MRNLSLKVAIWNLILLFLGFGIILYFIQPDLHWSVFAIPPLLSSLFIVLYLPKKLKKDFNAPLSGILNTLQTMGNRRLSDISSDTHIIAKIEDTLTRLKEEKQAAEGPRAMREQFQKEFLGNISHEIKTPIFNMEGYLHTLIDGGLEDPTINKQYIHKAINNLDRLKVIVNELENISALEAGKDKLTISTFDLKELFLDEMEDLESMADSESVKLSLTSKTPIKVLVKADKMWIRQVIANLLTNSIKYAKPEGGQTIVEFTQTDLTWVIHIKDNGIGIPTEHLDKIFERFYRVDESRERKIGGVGLGLAIVKQIIHAHGHEISVESDLGKGSTFIFTLPRA